MDKRLEIISQLFEVAMRINLETDRCCFFDVSGHVSSVKIKVVGSKEKYLERITTHEFYYSEDEYQDDKGMAEFLDRAKIALDDLNNVLSAKWDKRYTAYCNLIDMSCDQVFTSEAAAKAWVKKMKRKYESVHAIVGYKEELMKDGAPVETKRF